MGEFTQSIKLTLKDEFSQKMTSIAKKTKAFRETTSKVGGGLQKFGAGTSAVGKKLSVLSAGFVAAGAGAFALLKRQANLNDELRKTSARIGLSSDSLQAWRFSAELGGATAADVTTGFRRLSRSMIDAQEGTGAAKDAFDALGISTKNADGSLKSSEQVMLEISDAFNSMEDGARKTAIAQELLGRSGTNLINTLNGGSSAIADQRKELEQMGGIISEDTLRASEAFNDAIARLKSAVTALSAGIASDLIPKLTPLIDRFREWVTSADGGRAVIANLIERVKMIVRWFRELSPTMQKVVAIFGVLTPIIPPLLVVLGSVASAIGTLISLIGPMTTVFSALGSAIGAVVAVLGGPVTIGILAIIAAGALLVSEWENISSTFIGIWNNIVNGLAGIISDIIILFDKWSPLEKVQESWNPVKDFFGQLWAEIKAIFDRVMDSIGERISAVTDTIKGVTGLAKSLGGGAKELGSKAREGLSKIGGGISSGFTSAKNFFGFGDDEKSQANQVAQSQQASIQNNNNNNVVVNLAVDKTGTPILQGVDADSRPTINLNTGSIVPVM